MKNIKNAGVLFILFFLISMLFTVSACSKSYNVTFITNGGENIASISLKKGEKVNCPDATKEGYSFVGWYTDESLNKAFNFDTELTDNLTLYAKWNINNYTITFNSEGGSVIDPITAEYNEAVNAPQPPEKTGYTFSGWYIDSEKNGEQYSFSTMPAEDLILFADWTINDYTITFNSNDGSSVNPITADFGTEITAPVAPVKEGYSFVGWYSNSSLTGNIYEFTTVPAENITLYAKWSVNTYIISFNTNGGDTMASQSYDYNETIITPDDPVRNGYTFIGWYNNAELTGEMYSFGGNMPAQNINLYASWGINNYSVNYYSGNTLLDSETYNFNEQLISPEDPEKEGYTFLAWYMDQELLGDEFLFNILMPSNDINVYAKWSINHYQLSFSTGEGSAVSDAEYAYNEQISAPANPTRTDFYFGGWYTDNTYTTEYVFNTMPAASFTLYALWEYKIKAIPYGDGAEVTGLHSSEPLNSILEIPTVIEIQGTSLTVYSIGDSAFSGNSSLTAITFETGTQIIKIGAAAFSNCRNLVSFEFPDTIEIISDSAFCSCLKLSDFIISENSNLISIGDNAFNDTIFTQIYLPESVNSLGTHMFNKYLNSINVAAGNTLYASSDGVLYNKALTELISFPAAKTTDSYTLISSVATIKPYAFFGCKADSIILSEGVTIISEYAFHTSTARYIEISSTVTEIGQEAFSYCTNLKILLIDSDILIPIGENPFYFMMQGIFPNYIYVHTDLLDDYQSAANWSAFASKMYSFDEHDNVCVYEDKIDYLSVKNYIGKGNTIVIPSECNSQSVKEIGSNAFKNYPSITSVTIPDSIERIYEYAFSNTHITEITLPASLTEIHQSFENCTYLASVTFAATSTLSIFNRAFYGCPISVLELPSTTVYLEQGSLAGMSSLQRLEIPFVGSQLGAEDEASLFGYIFGESEYTDSIGVEQYYSSTESIIYYIPQNLAYLTVLNGDIPYGAFSQCSMLMNVTLMQINNYHINENAFFNCYNLETVLCGDNLITIDSYAFKNCYSLSSINIGINVTEIGYSSFLNCSLLTFITLPNTLLNIGSYAFSNSGLTEITLPNGLQVISSYAFENCQFTEVTIPSSVIEIGDKAFDIDLLTAVNVERSAITSGSITIINGHAFGDDVSFSNLTVFVPSDSYTDYYNAASGYAYQNNIDTIS